MMPHPRHLQLEEASLPRDISRVIDADILDIPATQLVFNASIDTTNMANVVLIDSILADKQVFYDSANANTFPIIYDYNSKTDDLLALFRQKFPASSIQRISLAFHDRGPNFMAAFMNNKPLFQEIDLAQDQTSFTDNVSFLVSCIKEFHVSHIDFLACNTLQYSNWKSYYALLAAQTSVVVGASNDKTGNLNYGGDWMMENTHENVRDLYFNANISNYASTLAAINISANGTTQAIYLQMSGTDMQYSIGSVPGSWTTIASGDWPVTITNSCACDSSVLRVVFTQDLTISNTYGNTAGYFIAGSSYITFDGSNNFINITNITLYPGFIQNGSTPTLTNGYANVIVKNIKTNVTGTSSLNSETAASGSRAGWICAGSFGRGALENQIINCRNTGVVNAFGGGICGDTAGTLGGSVTFISCTNSGTIGLNAGGIASLSAGRFSGSVIFVNCTNSGEISGESAGGIVGPSTGVIGSARITGCTNTGDISGNYAGGIAGSACGAGDASGNTGIITITRCTNSGEIRGESAGGIAGLNAGSTNGLATFTNCTNSGIISGFKAGGIAGQQAGNRGEATFIGCTNNGLINASIAGGIAGALAGLGDASLNIIGSVDFKFCTNTRDISGYGSGGIVGTQAGQEGLCSLTKCVNTGLISGGESGGITGSRFGYTGGLVSLYKCFSTGTISGPDAGGICGGYAGYSGGYVSLVECFSTGTISGQYAGGIAGSVFGFNTSQTCLIIRSYSTGSISGNNAGGIVGADVGLVNSTLITTSDVNITDCYSQGAISATCGGICGGNDPAAVYTNTPTITITNCYSSGTIVNANSGIVSTSYPKPTTQTNIYVAAGSWSDASANAPLALTGTPTNINTNNPGATWTMIAPGTPYVLSGYDAALYSPDSASTSSSTYTSAAGLFSPGYNYQLIYTDQVGDEIIANVFVSKGTAPYYSDYNFNTYTLSSTLNGLYAAATRIALSPGTSVTINSSTGVLYFILPSPPPSPRPMQNVPMISGGGGSFWFGRDGFLFKRKGGGGASRSTKMAPGGNATCNGPTYIYNKFKPGGGGVGASSVANRRAKNRLATVCTGQKCFPCYTTLGQYSNYTHNPNGYVPCPAPTPSNTPVVITYSVTYNGNTNTGGTAPVDGSSPYSPGSYVTILGPGSLTKIGYFFYEWNTAANGSGTSYLLGNTFAIYANTILYAIWYTDG